jgi:hypothetical protein
VAVEKFFPAKFGKTKWRQEALQKILSGLAGISLFENERLHAGTGNERREISSVKPTSWLSERAR